MQAADRPDAVQAAGAPLSVLGQAPGAAEAAAQWAQNMAGMQAMYKQSAAANPAYLQPNMAAYYASAAQFTPLLYNAHMMNGLGSMANPYAFMPGALPQPQPLPAGGPAPSGTQAPSASGREKKVQEQQDPAPSKRPKRDKSVADLKQEQSEPSGSQSPQSDPGSELTPGFGARAGLEGEGDLSGPLGASSSFQNLAGSAGGLGLQDEREVKKLRRKQSNRESARRSRLRKQAECEALSGKVAGLVQENLQLKESNRSLLARVEELVARLEHQKAAERPPAAKPRQTLAGDGAFTPVVGLRRLQSPAEGSAGPPSDPSQPSTQTTESSVPATVSEPAAAAAPDSQ